MYSAAHLQDILDQCDKDTLRGPVLAAVIQHGHDKVPNIKCDNTTAYLYIYTTHAHGPVQQVFFYYIFVVMFDCAACNMPGLMPPRPCCTLEPCSTEGPSHCAVSVRVRVRVFVYYYTIPILKPTSLLCLCTC